MGLDLRELIQDFIRHSQSDTEFEIYNEAGMQHELAYYLRTQFCKNKNYHNYHLYLEKNINSIGIELNSSNFIKDEMDIFVKSKTNNEKYCIELKLPENKASQKIMYDTFIDVNFLENLKLMSDFTGCALLFFSSLGRFQLNGKKEGLYKYFREEKRICQIANQKYISSVENMIRSKPLNIQGNYSFVWEKFNDDYNYFIIEL